MVDKVLKAILLFTPVFYCVGVNYYKVEIIYFQIASIILFMASMADVPIRRFNIRKLMCLFIGICLYSVIVNGYSTKSLSALINVFLGCMDVYIITVYCRDLKKSFSWLMIGLGINTVVMIGQMLGYSPIIDPATIQGKSGEMFRGEYGGIIGNAPRFANFIALCLPFVSRWYILPAIVLGVILNELSIFVSIFAILFYETASRKMYKTMAGLILLSIAGTVSVFPKIISSSMLRFNIWKDVFHITALRPWKGYGIGTLGIADYGFSIMQWISGVGFFGIGFVLICLKRMKWYLIPLLFLCVFEYPFETPRLYPLLICVIAYFAINQKEERLC